MKKLFLLLAAGSITMNVIAQERQVMMAPKNAENQYRKIDGSLLMPQGILNKSHGAAKTTVGGSRAYNHAVAIDTSANYYNNVTLGGGPGGNGSFTGLHALMEETIWNDTNGTVLYSGGDYRHIITVSQGSIFDPAAAIFNVDPDQAYIGQIRVKAGTTGDAYTVDSVTIYGVYLYNKTKTTVVDTLRLVFMTGDGSTGSNIGGAGFGGSGAPHYGPVTFLDLRYDSVHNVGSGPVPAQLYPSTATYPHYDIILNNSGLTPAWGDTMSNGIWTKTIPRSALGASGMPVPAGSFAGMTITFKSGDPVTKVGALASPTPGDTLVSSSAGTPGMNKYNVWRPLSSYYATGGSTAAYAPYQCPTYEPYPADQNLGYWKTLPNYSNGWDNLYYPGAWGYSLVGGGAYPLQFPYMTWYITCPTCATITSAYLGTNTLPTVNSINAVPNPATDEVNVTFSLTEVSDVFVSLANIMGQVVATQKVNNTAEGKAVFNTSVLANGIYIYTLEANGGRTSGRIVVAH